MQQRWGCNLGFCTGNWVHDDFIYSGGEAGRERKKIKNSDWIWLPLRHPKGDVKKALCSLELCCPVRQPLAHVNVWIQIKSNNKFTSLVT